jgi:uncharacterized protein
MSTIVKSIIFTILMTVASWHYAASFDCTKAKSVSENLICRDYELSQKDDELNLAYQQAKSIWGNDSEFRENQIEAWKWREANCFDKTCLLRWYASRKSHFDSMLVTQNFQQNASDLRVTKCIRLGLLPGSQDYNECIR